MTGKTWSKALFFTGWFVVFVSLVLQFPLGALDSLALIGLIVMAMGARPFVLPKVD